MQVFQSWCGRYSTHTYQCVDVSIEKKIQHTYILLVSFHCYAQEAYFNEKHQFVFINDVKECHSTLNK